MSIRVMSAVWETAQVEGGDLLVLLALADHASDDGICYPSVARLAARARLSERAVQYSLRSLSSLGLIVVEHSCGPKGCNRYTVQTIHPAKSAPVQMEAKGGANSDRGGANGDIKGCSGLHPNHQEPSKKHKEPVTLPKCLPQETWDAFDESRRTGTKRKQWTPVAQRRFINLVEKCHADGLDVVQMIDASIVSGYPTIYPQANSPRRKMTIDDRVRPLQEGEDFWLYGGAK